MLVACGRKLGPRKGGGGAEREADAPQPHAILNSVLRTRVSLGEKLPVDFVETMASDTKRAACDMILASSPRPEHLFEDMQCGYRREGGMCLIHNAVCLPPSTPEDLFICGWPCQPFSRQNAYRGKRDVADHPKFEVGEFVLMHLRVRQPRVAILENVAGMLPHSVVPFLQDLKAVPEYSCQVIHLDSDIWYEGCRPR